MTVDETLLRMFAHAHEEHSSAEQTAEAFGIEL